MTQETKVDTLAHPENITKAKGDNTQIKTQIANKDQVGIEAVIIAIDVITTTKVIKSHIIR